MYAVYLIQNEASKELYIGYTRDIKARITQHNARLNKSTSREVGIWKYVYIELYRSEEDARARERKLKHHGSAKHELLKRLMKSVMLEPKTGAGRKVKHTL